MNSSSVRRVAALLSASAVAAVAATPASAQLGLPLGSLTSALPNVGGLITGTGNALGNTVGSLVPGAGGVVSGVTGAAGGIVGGLQGTVGGVVDNSVGSVLAAGGGVLPTSTLNALLGAVAPSVTGGTLGTVLAGGTAVPGGAIVDASAPRPDVSVLSHLTSVARNGHLKIKVSTNEPGIVAFSTALRPGAAVSKARSVSHKVIKIPAVVLGYSRAGALTVTVKLSRAAQRALGRSRSARVSVAMISADLHRNQAADQAHLKIGR